MPEDGGGLFEQIKRKLGMGTDPKQTEVTHPGHLPDPENPAMPGNKVMEDIYRVNPPIPTLKQREEAATPPDPKEPSQDQRDPRP